MDANVIKSKKIKSREEGFGRGSGGGELVSTRKERFCRLFRWVRPVLGAHPQMILQ